MSDEPTLGEIGRRLESFQESFRQSMGNVTEEIRLLRAELVRRDVYDANRITDQQRIFSVESQIKDLTNQKRSYQLTTYSALAIALCTLVVSILLKVVFHQ